jgi:hypothetical protein
MSEEIDDETGLPKIVCADHHVLAQFVNAVQGIIEMVEMDPQFADPEKEPHGYAHMVWAKEMIRKITTGKCSFDDLLSPKGGD